MRKFLLLTMSGLAVVAALVGVYAIAISLRSPVLYADQARERADGGTALRPTVGRRENKDESKEIAARDKWFYGQRAYPEKHVEHTKLRRAQAEARTIGRDIAAEDGAEDPQNGLNRAAPTAALSWTSLGPQPIDDGAPSEYNGTAPWAGRVTAIANHPTSSATAYVGGATGGVWKTTTDGTSWTPVFDSQPSLAVGAIGIDPNNGETLYVGTGEANFGADSYFGAGIFKSTNGGATWTKVGGTTFDDCHVADVIVKPGASSTVFAAVHPYGRTGTACPSGVFRSTDAGASWTEVAAFGAPTDLAFKPGSPSTIYSSWWGSGVYKSTANGAAGSWAYSGLYSNDAGRIALATTKANPDRLYASIMDTGSAYGGTLGTYSSTDSGATWSALPSQNYCGYAGQSGGQCSYDLALAADPVSQTALYAAGIRLFKHTTTGGWGLLGYGTSGIHVDIHALAFDAANRLWVGSDGGVWRKGAGGDTRFTNLNKGLSLTQFTQGTSGSVAQRFVGGTQDNGTLHRLASSGKWYEFSTGDGGHSAVDPANPDTVYSSYIYATLSKSTDGGASNTCLFTASEGYQPWCAFYAPDSSRFYTPVEMSPANASTLYVGTTRVWRTTTGGSAWTAVSPHFAGEISALGAARSAPNTVYAAWGSYSATGVKKTTDGTTWTDTGALPDRVITHIEVDPASSGTAYAALSGFGTGHVYRTTNGGATWTNLSGNLPDSPVNAIAIDRRTSPTTLYAATDVGVFWSVDGGKAWANANRGLPNTVVSDVRVDLPANRIVAATYGRGAYSVPVASPQVRSFTPASGATGSSITISGVNLTGATAVKIGTKTATFTVNSPTQITARVPDGTASGKVSVTTGAGTAVSTRSYTVTKAVSSFSPTSGPAGTSVVIRGVGFTGATAVRFNGVAASRTVNSSTQITAKVPSSATTGKISVTTSDGTVVTSASSFRKT